MLSESQDSCTMLCPGDIFSGLLQRLYFPCGNSLWLSCLNRQIPGVSRWGTSKGGFQEPELLANVAPYCFHDAVLWWSFTVCYMSFVVCIVWNVGKWGWGSGTVVGATLFLHKMWFLRIRNRGGYMHACKFTMFLCAFQNCSN